MYRCPMCGAEVEGYFDHVDRDCENDEIREIERKAMTTPTMTPVEGSSQIKAVGRDGDHLLVEFHGFAGKPSSTYRYWRKDGSEGDHPTAHHDTLLTIGKDGGSAGKHFNTKIRHVFAFEKVSS